MTVATAFFNWQSWGVNPAQSEFVKCSPNLHLVEDFTKDRWDLRNVGCRVVRFVVGGSSWSDHAYGAAIDQGWGHWVVAPQTLADARKVLLDDVFPWLIANSKELGVQAIHDYWCLGEPHETRDEGRVWPVIDAATGLPKCGGGRVWRSWRPSGGGWRDQEVKPDDDDYQFHRPGNRWIHIGTGAADWSNTTPIDVRLSPSEIRLAEDDMTANILVQERVTATGQLANAVWEYMPHAGRKRCITLTTTMLPDTLTLFTDRGWSLAVKVVATDDMPVYGLVDGPVPQRAGSPAYDGWGRLKA